jgi:hypothetical protein
MTVFRRLALLGLCTVFGVVLAGGAAMAVEEPSFTTVFRDGAFEIRDYPPSVVAEVTVEGDQKQAAGRGFRLLAGYIFGGNRRRQSIAMTAPVAEIPAGQKIAMTAPVTQAGNDGRWVVRFTMPKSYTLDSLPVPNDPRVHLRRLPASQMVVLRFSGVAGQRDLDEKSKALDGMVKARGLKVVGPPSLAQYDPPWTLWFMRRNEVMVGVSR